MDKGDIFGYIGPNGAGKTTTIKILVGLITEFQGEVLINNIPIVKAERSLHKNLGYLPQEVGFQEWRTVDHTLKTFGRLSGIKKEFIDERINESLKLARLDDSRYKKVKYLSGGMQQKLRLAQAIINKPEILVLDEPLSGLDPSSRFQVKQMIKDFAKKQVTIFFSSHILSDVEDFATKIAIINRGRILRIISTDAFREELDNSKILKIEYSAKTQEIPNFNNFSFIDSIEQENNMQIIHLTEESDLDYSISEILNYTLEKKVKIRRFNVHKPSLEDIYMNLMEGDIK